MKRNFILLFIILLLCSFSSDKPAYQLFNAKGEKSTYQKMLTDAAKAEVIFFGELHNNPISHWLQLELTKDLFAQKGANLILAAEMFEADNQLIIDEYLAGLIKDNNFEKECKLWNNYQTDYKPLLEFAKNNKLKFIASNIPRRYAAIVNQQGFEGLEKLSKDALNCIAPLPIRYDPTIKCYKQMLQMFSGMASRHVDQNLPKAQAVKDATMAHFILLNLKKEYQILHFNGAYHSDNYEGIVWHLKNIKPDLKIMTISTVEQSKIDSLQNESKGVADYVIAVPENMTKTY